jgi:hypothetical protein
VSRNRYHVGLHLNITDKTKMLELIKFWSSANGYTPLTDKDVLRLAFDQLYTATKQLIKKKEAANEFDTKVVGGPESSSAASPTETSVSDTNAEPTYEVVRDESTGNIVEQVVSGT